MHLEWKRLSEKPFLTPNINSHASDAVTTPDALVEGEDVSIFVGAVKDQKERLIHFKLPVADFSNTDSVPVPEEARIILDTGPYEYDACHVFDPAVIDWNEKKYLYYSAIGEGPDSVGLAISSGGEFIKLNHALFFGRSPEVVIRDGECFIFFVVNDEAGFYSIYASRSLDGIHFDKVSDQPVVNPGTRDDWDALEITTPRIFEVEDWYYMIYAGVAASGKKDIPKAFGLCRSRDLVSWKKYPFNPVFRAGKDGSWDDTAIWFGSPFIIGNRINILYEGGSAEGIREGQISLTQVGLAYLELDEFFKDVEEWD